MNSLLEDVRRTIADYDMISPGDSLVLGVSGGADSLCLLHVLKVLSKEYNISIFAVHLNHKFRGAEGDADAAFVEQICKKWEIPAQIQVFDVPAYVEQTGLSPEEAGREIRYKLFEEVRARIKANKIAVAQNLNDNVETVLMRFLRGTGPEGLKGIEPVRGNIIRPLLSIERASIEEYCKIYNLEPRTDSTNLQPIYLRNKIRLELIPYLKEAYNPNINSAVMRLSDIIREDNAYLDSKTEEEFALCTKLAAGKVIYQSEHLQKLHLAIRRRLIRRGLAQLLGSTKGFDGKHIDGALELLDKSTGAAIELPGRIKAYISYHQLILAKNIEKSTKKCYYILKPDSTIELDDQYAIAVRMMDIKEAKSLKHTSFTACLDAEKFRSQPVLRTRQEGDVFAPIGMKGSKKLKDYFIDEKLPREQRSQQMLLADGQEIVWVVGKRISERYKLTSETKKVLTVSIEKKNEK